MEECKRQMLFSEINYAMNYEMRIPRYKFIAGTSRTPQAGVFKLKKIILWRNCIYVNNMTPAH